MSVEYEFVPIKSPIKRVAKPMLKNEKSLGAVYVRVRVRLSFGCSDGILNSSSVDLTNLVLKELFPKTDHRAV